MKSVNICSEAMQVVSITLVVIAVVKSSLISTKTIDPPKCHVITNSSINETSTDCSGLGWTYVHTDLIPRNTTRLDLSGNDLRELNNASLSTFRLLTHLYLQDNSLKTIAIDTFRELSDLQVLDLESNDLDLSRLAGGMFKWMPKLHVLKLAHNKNYKRSGSYPDDLFDGVAGLQNLSLDTFHSILKFGPIFTKFYQLRSLYLSGGMTELANETFHTLNHLPITALTFNDLTHLRNTTINTFQYFPRLQNFKAYYLYRWNKHELLKSLYPFQGRNMTTIDLLKTGPHFSAPGAELCKDGILDSKSTAFLANIRVERFLFRNSNVYVIENGVFTWPLWANYLKYLDLSYNLLIGQGSLVFRLPVMHALVEFVFSHRGHDSRRDDTLIDNSKGTMWSGEEPDIHSHSNNSAQMISNTFDQSQPERNHSTVDQWQRFVISNNVPGFENRFERPNAHPRNALFSGFDSTPQRNENAYKIRLPMNLEIIHVDSISGHLFELDHLNYEVVGKTKLRELYFSNNGAVFLSGLVFGLQRLHVLDMSQNDCNRMNASFFDYFPGLRSLRMKASFVGDDLVPPNTERLFRSLQKLTELDLSANRLVLLSNSSFRTNGNLEMVDLSQNRFANIPFDISHTPKLKRLDLRSNSIVSLTRADTQALDAHARGQPSFTVLLQSNLFLCGCSTLTFLQWLQFTAIHLDADRNYSCIAEDGTLSNTFYQQDLKAQWRLCNGKFFFVLSICLLFAMALGFTITIFCMRFKTRIKAGLFRLVFRGFRLKSLQDYDIGVFVAYADSDFGFSCFTLRALLEDQFEVTTYLKSRDLIPGTDMAESIVDAINSSWRVLLVVTREFLDNDQWSYFTMKTAAYSVSPENPALLIAVVEEDVFHRIPRCLRRAVEEDSVVWLPRDRILGYEQIQRLKTLILQ